METLVIPKTAYSILRRLTGESRPDLALSLALKDLVHLRLEAAENTIRVMEGKYGMPFLEFAEQWQAGQIPAGYSYPVEQDYWTWEAAASDLKALEELAGQIP